MLKIKVKKLSSDATLPTRAYPTDAGLDLYSLETKTVAPFEGHTFPTGISAHFPNTMVGLITDRSSMASSGWKTSGGVIDTNYSGELSVVLRNLTLKPMVVNKGDRIAQLLLLDVHTPEVMEVTVLEDQGRSTNGFGSSGK